MYIYMYYSYRLLLIFPSCIYVLHATRCQHPQCAWCHTQNVGVRKAREILLTNSVDLQVGNLFVPGACAPVARGILHMIFGKVSDKRRAAHFGYIFFFGRAGRWDLFYTLALTGFEFSG